MLCFIAMAAFSLEVKAQNNERINAGYIIAFGRLASSAELTYWNAQGNLSVQKIVELHKNYIKSNPGSAGREVIIKSYLDGLGYLPTAAEIQYHTKFGRTYAEMVTAHMNYITTYPSEYEKIIKRSYQTILLRQPNINEINYWKSQGVICYAMLINCHQDWKNRNATGQSQRIAVASNAPFIISAPVSAAVLAETKQAFNSLVSPGGGNMVAAGGGNMVAAGGGNMVAAGGGNMVAAGGGNMVAAGGGN